MVEQRILNIAAYRFTALDPHRLPEWRKDLKDLCDRLGLRGTILIAPEGVNCFVAGEAAQIAEFKTEFERVLGLMSVVYKESWSSNQPFTRMLVKIKKEIIPLGDPSVKPHEFTGQNLKPEELKNWIESGKDFVLIDTRNRYETQIGTFENAVDLEIDHFRHIGEKAEKIDTDVKEKPVVMFCTGGIRCEKASVVFMQKGFKEVYQLEGGILGYFEKVGASHFKGNCFVFDWREAVDGELNPVNRSCTAPEGYTTGRHLKKI